LLKIRWNIFLFSLTILPDVWMISWSKKTYIKCIHGEGFYNSISILYTPSLYMSAFGRIHPVMIRFYDLAVAPSSSSTPSNSDSSSNNLTDASSLFNSLSVFISVHSCLFNTFLSIEELQCQKCLFHIKRIDWIPYFSLKMRIVNLFQFKLLLFVVTRTFCVLCLLCIYQDRENGKLLLEISSVKIFDQVVIL